MKPFTALLPLFALALALSAACNNDARPYRPCPLGADPARFDCVPTYPEGALVALDAGALPPLDATPGPRDTSPLPDVNPDVRPGPDTPSEPDVACIPQCDFRTCGADACGGVCGTCESGFVCGEFGQCMPSGQEGLTCGQVIECLQNCDNDFCAQRCLDRGSPDAQDIVYNIFMCIEQNCWRFQDDPEAMARCQRTECADAFNECADGPNVGEQRTCRDTFMCALNCGDNQPRCQEQCRARASDEAMDLVVRLDRCAEDACPGITPQGEWFDCVSERCPEELTTCFESDPTPSGACSERDIQRFETSGEEMAWIIADCGYSCVEQRNPQACAQRCSQSLQISDSCAQCTGSLSLCLATQCGEYCEDPLSSGCESCVDSRCGDAFIVCGGFAP